MTPKNKFLSNSTIAILDTIPFGIYYCDSLAIVRYINKPYADYLGLDAKDIIGKQITDVIPGSRARGVIESGQEELYDTVSVFQEKNQNILVNRMPVKNAEGQIEGFISQLFSVGKSDWQGIWKKIEQAEKTLRYLQQEAGQFNSNCSELIVGKSPALLRCMEKLTSYATTGLPVLITGETGVGKELFANAIHRNSQYANGPMVTINCSSFPAELVESELFGYAPGAFTNALRFGKMGRIESADKGTLFLDELGDLSLRGQAALLRVLETRKVQRIGSNTLNTVDFRLVAATNRDIEAMIKLGQFREDFYYRVNILRLHAPPLSERVEDIPDLVKYFLGKIGKEKAIISDEVMHIFKTYLWPGNIRELRNVVMCAAISCKNDIITIDVLPENLNKNSHNLPFSCDLPLSCDNFSLRDRVGQNPDSSGPGSMPAATLAKWERTAIINALRANQYNRARTARALGIARTTLYQKLKKYSISCDIIG
jgi:transcriptional regulator with PAS, ATPase and Fis domain